jgi:hypothetical protein
MGRYSWSRLNKQQVGRFAEYFAKMEFALYGFEVYTAEVDDRGIDFVARYGSGGFYEVQVKSARETNYVFMQKSKFPIRADRLLALVMLEEEKAPDLYLIPATAWLEPNALLVGRDYEGLKSPPEWGVQLSERNRPLLSSYGFDSAIAVLCQEDVAV